uniref:LTD domain-containing protein n=1 Tax=Sus scrofa TaxID=9823 RepID=A0A8D1A1M3_PIG
KNTHDNLPKARRSLVYFVPISTDSDTTTLPWSRSLSNEILLSCYVSSPQVSGVTISTIGPKPLKPALVIHSQSENSNTFKIPKKQTLSVPTPEPAVIGEGEDYFLSLFGDSRKLNEHSLHTEKVWKHFSMILEEVGQSRSSALGDVKIAEVNVKGLFVKLINSSLDKELEIGNYILQQNVDGQRVSLYQFLPDIIMQANSTVTAVAWYTPVHWKQAWEKLETDIEFDRCSVVGSASRRHMFHWPTVTTTTKGKQDQSKKDSSKYQLEQVRAFLKREKEIPPTLFPNRSPWCHSPNVSAHPYCPLIDPHTCMAGRSLDRQPKPRSARPDPAQQKKKKKKEKERKKKN